MKKCANCSRQVPSKSKVCSYCGNKFSETHTKEQNNIGNEAIVAHDDNSTKKNNKWLIPSVIFCIILVTSWLILFLFSNYKSESEWIVSDATDPTIRLLKKNNFDTTDFVKLHSASKEKYIENEDNLGVLLNDDIYPINQRYLVYARFKNGKDYPIIAAPKYDDKSLVVELSAEARQNLETDYKLIDGKDNNLDPTTSETYFSSDQTYSTTSETYSSSDQTYSTNEGAPRLDIFNSLSDAKKLAIENQQRIVSQGGNEDDVESPSSAVYGASTLLREKYPDQTDYIDEVINDLGY